MSHSLQDIDRKTAASQRRASGDATYRIEPSGCDCSALAGCTGRCPCANMVPESIAKIPHCLGMYGMPCGRRLTRQWPPRELEIVATIILAVVNPSRGQR